MLLDSHTMLFLRAPVAVIAAALSGCSVAGCPMPEGLKSGLWLRSVWAPPVFFLDSETTCLLFLLSLSQYVICNKRCSLPFGRLPHPPCFLPVLLHISFILLIAISYEFVFTDLKADYVARTLIFGPIMTIQSFLLLRHCSPTGRPFHGKNIA